jgi:hypothetical protein
MQRRHPKVWNLGIGLGRANWFVKMMDESEKPTKDERFEDALRKFKRSYKRVDDGAGDKKWVLRPGAENPRGESITPQRYVVTKVKTRTKKWKP